MNTKKLKFDTVEEAVEDLKNGKMVIVADDEARENEGDLIVAAEFATPEAINFMISECKGLVCLSITTERAQELELTEMVQKNTDAKKTAFTQSVDASPEFGVTTGISAFDRSKTIKIITDKNTKPEDLRRPGHIFPLIAKKGGVLQRVGHTEASVDLMKIAGMYPSAVICEIINHDGTMARRDDLMRFAAKYNLKFITVEQLIKYRLAKEKLIKREATANLPTEYGDFKIYGYTNTINNQEQVALIKDDGSDKIPLVRVHSECLTGDIFHSLRCDCRNQLEEAIKMVNDYGKGAIIYIRGHEGRGIGIVNKIKAYKLQECGQDTIEANVSLGFEPDLRTYGIGAQILLDLGYKKFKLITNNPKKNNSLNVYGLENY
jgi:3,4-dihydroxy 2-butanone 4-phosphate synthase/GTP cyclohydrolase II